MKRFAPLILLLGVELTSLRASDGHHFQGLAVVSPPRGSAFVAAFTIEAMDPIHTPELHLRDLWRLTLVPFSQSSVVGDRISTTCETSGGPTTAGHIVMDFCSFRIELIPTDQALRRANAQAAVGFLPGPPSLQTIVVTFGGPRTSDGDYHDAITIVGFERE